MIQIIFREFREQIRVYKVLELIKVLNYYFIFFIDSQKYLVLTRWYNNIYKIIFARKNKIKKEKADLADYYSKLFEKDKKKKRNAPEQINPLSNLLGQAQGDDAPLLENESYNKKKSEEFED